MAIHERHFAVFPESAQRRAGQQLALLQEGHDPYDWKPMPSIGAGVREIRIRDEHGIFRVLYVTKFAEHIYCAPLFSKEDPANKPGRY